jgi:hypothetical protein
MKVSQAMQSFQEYQRNRIMLELKVRGGMRFGELLKIEPMGIQVGLFTKQPQIPKNACRN